MADSVEEMGSISDGSYLLTRLRLAKRENDIGTANAVLEQLRKTGVLREQEPGEGAPYRNLREQVSRILGAESPVRNSIKEG